MAKPDQEQQVWAEQEQRFRQDEEQISQRWIVTFWAVFPLFSLTMCWLAPNIPVLMRIITSVFLVLLFLWITVRAVRTWVLTFRYCREMRKEAQAFQSDHSTPAPVDKHSNATI